MRAGVLAIVAGFLLTGAATAEVTTVIHAGTLIADPAQPPLHDQSIVIVDGRVRSVERGFVAVPGATTIDLRSAYVLPGLINAHVHLQFGTQTFRKDLVEVEDGVLVLRALSEASRALAAGFTTLRDMAGDPDIVFSLRDAISRGIVTGPRIVAAGPAIEPTGGGIIRGFRRDVLELLAERNHLETFCDGPDDCARAAREAINNGADFVKVVVTGSILAPNSARSQQMSTPELDAIIGAARGMNKRVSAHAHGLPGINAALSAGVQSIEHGTFGDESSIQLYRKTGAFLVPTMSSLMLLRQRVDADPGVDPRVKENILAGAARVTDMVRLAYKSGVRIAFGTDSNIGTLASAAGEFRLLQEAGMSEEDMVRSATVQAAALLGLEEDIGTIGAGKVADIIAVRADPLKDITVLERVEFVMKGGVVIRNDVAE
jgi:imidazolonepropionase-like amidohydrolase